MAGERRRDMKPLKSGAAADSRLARARANDADSGSARCVKSSTHEHEFMPAGHSTACPAGSARRPVRHLLTNGPRRSEWCRAAGGAVLWRCCIAWLPLDPHRGLSGARSSGRIRRAARGIGPHKPRKPSIKPPPIRSLPHGAVNAAAKTPPPPLAIRRAARAHHASAMLLLPDTSDRNRQVLLGLASIPSRTSSRSNRHRSTCRFAL